MEDFNDDGDLPPPYSAAVNASSTVSAQHADPRAYSSLFACHVADLRAQITASQAARASARDDRDSYILSLIVPYMEDFFAFISEIHPTPKLAVATLVPDAAIGKDWKFNDEDEKRAGVVRKLIRVRDASKKKKMEDSYPAEKGSHGGDDVDGAGPSFWWENEGTARRLAKHLQPERPAGAKNTQIVTDRNSNKKSGFRGLFRRSSDIVESAAAVVEERDGVVLTARAEEVTFRRENELGIWETQTGWGIVVRVRIQSV